MCFACVRNIMFEHKINFCVDFVRMACFPFVWLCFICVSLSSRWVRVRLLCVYVGIEHMLNSKWFQISTTWTQKNLDHPLAPICLEVDSVVAGEYHCTLYCIMIVVNQLRMLAAWPHTSHIMPAAFIDTVYFLDLSDNTTLTIVWIKSLIKCTTEKCMHKFCREMPSDRWVTSLRNKHVLNLLVFIESVSEGYPN